MSSGVALNPYSTTSRLSQTARAVFFPYLLSAALVVAGGCSKEEKADAPPAQQASTQAAVEDGLLSLAMLKKIPATSAGFFAADLKGESYKKFMASPWGAQAGGLSFFQMALDELKKDGADSEEAKAAEAVMNGFKKLGLLSPEGKPQAEKVFSEFVFFVDTPPAGQEERTNAGAFASAADGANLKEKLSILESTLKDAGLPTAKETFQGAEGFAIPLGGMGGEAAGATDAVGSVFFAASEKRFAFGRSKPTVESAFKDDTADGIASLKGAPEFQKAYNSVKTSDSSMTMAYLSVSRLVPFLEKMSKEGATADQSANLDPKTFPVDAFIMTQAMDASLNSKVAVAVSPRSENQKTIFSAFEGGTTPAAASKLPSDVALAIALDTKFVNKLEPLLKDVQDNPAIAEGFKVLKNLNGLTLGLRNNDGGSPFPDLFLALESSNREDLGKVLETMVGQAMASSGAPAMPWQTKDISGAPTRFFATPFGVGMYVASPKDSSTLLVASSERAVKDSIAAGASGSTSSLAAGLSQGFKDRAAAGKLGMVFLNFNQVGNLVEGVKSNLAMFMAGNEELEKMIDANKIRSWGSTITGFGFADGVLRFESAVEAPPTGK
jgi:hypothetical protein